MKVVIINTEYVETDAGNFKSVVQRLTGKDSTIECKRPESALNRRSAVSRVDQPMPTGNSVFSRGVSFKDFDRLLKELPPFDELYRLCADN
ncbi:VQ motif-containing protein 10 [Cornus florida]|uniref:VQ motif-containing protein 10 n=1 Tax=Cornus florida TaxID=4283 RepID=UPI00289725B5|nr:VQ motif-containing protein 10 [Cornus florida]